MKFVRAKIFLLIVGVFCTVSLTAQLSLAQTAQRPLAPWPPPAGELRVIIDTDAANEVDDQWAIALALGFPERLKIEGFVAAHYGQRGGAKGIAKSRASIEATLAAAGMAGKFAIKNGSDPLAYRDRVSLSEGVDFIIAQAHLATPENPLWLILIGPATDGAAALLKDPSIADRVVIFWHGRSDWPEKCANFNALNDPLATQLLFELPCRFVLFDAGANLTLPMAESARRVGSVGTLGKFLHDLRLRSVYASRADKGMFDLGDLAALIHPVETCISEVVQAPGVRPDFRYDFKQTNGPMVRITAINREASFALLDESLVRLSQAAEKNAVSQPATSASVAGDSVAETNRIPLMIITDMYIPRLDGGDNFDLIMPFGLPELDLKAVIFDIHENYVKGKPFVGDFNRGTNGATKPMLRDPAVVGVEQLNYIFDRTVPYGMDPFTQMRSPDDKMLDAPKYQTSGIDLMLQVLRESPRKVNIVSTGSARALAVSWARDPELMREKVAMIYLSAGATIPTYLDYNVELDTNAMMGILRSGLPIALFPCSASKPGYGTYNSFAEWCGKDSNNGYWKLNNTDFIAAMDPRLQNYIAYGFSMTPPGAFLAAMDNPHPMVVRKQHNVWETCIWICLSGRRLVHRDDGTYRMIPASEVLQTDKILPNELKPCTVEVLAGGRYGFALTDKPTNYSIYYRGDADENERALQDAFPALYTSFRPSENFTKVQPQQN